MRVVNSVLCAILLLLGATVAAAPDLPTYAVTDLKALGIWPAAMNGRGDVVGSGATDRPYSGPTHTYLFSAGNLTELFPPTGAPSATFPRLLSDAGHVVFTTNTNTAWVYDGARYRRIEPPAPPGPQYSLSSLQVSGINTSGQIVGEAGYESTAPVAASPVVSAWLDDGGEVQVLNPAGARYCHVRGLNKWGDVGLQCDFGYSTDQGQVYRTVFGVRYSDGSWREIDDRSAYLIGINDSRAALVLGYDEVPSYLLDETGMHIVDPICDEGSTLCRAGVQNLNDGGEVVGLSNFNISTPQLPQVRTIQRALLWRNGLSVDISPPGNGNSRAWSINNHGVAVGTYINEAAKERPFIHASGTSMDLAELRGVGAALDLALADANSVSVEIVDSSHILVTSAWVDWRLGLHVPVGAYLLSPIVPTVVLSPSGTPARVGTPVTLTWSSQNANYCVAGGGTNGDGWAGDRATSGQATVTSNAAATVQYSMRCSAGPVYGDAKVALTYGKKSGGGGRLDGVAALLFGLGALGLRRRRQARSEASSLLRTALMAIARASVAVAALGALAGCGGSPRPPVGPPQVLLEASRTEIVSGDTISLEWTADGAKRCEASGAWSGPRVTSGSEAVSPVGPASTFWLTCIGRGGAADATVTINVAHLRFEPMLLPMDIVRALNERGDIAGAERFPAAGTWESRPRAIIDGRYFSVAYPGYHVGIATDINENQQVLISSGDLYTAGTIVKLAGLVSANGLAADGRAVGSVYVEGVSPCCVYHAALFISGVVADLGTLGGLNSRALGINDFGIIVGTSDVPAGSAGAGHAFRWERGVMTDLGTLGGASSVASAINEHGDIAGRADTVAATSRAFLRPRDGAMRDLGTLGGTGSEALGINDSAEVVGAAELADGTRRAFLYCKGAMYDLNRYLSAQLPLDHPLTSAVDVNNRGQIVAQACWTNPGCQGGRCDECKAYLLNPL